MRSNPREKLESGLSRRFVGLTSKGISPSRPDRLWTASAARQDHAFERDLLEQSVLGYPQRLFGFGA
jgi:hypothetical protein